MRVCDKNLENSKKGVCADIKHTASRKNIETKDDEQKEKAY